MQNCDEAYNVKCKYMIWIRIYTFLVLKFTFFPLSWATNMDLEWFWIIGRCCWCIDFTVTMLPFTGVMHSVFTMWSEPWNGAVVIEACCKVWVFGCFFFCWHMNEIGIDRGRQNTTLYFRYNSFWIEKKLCKINSYTATNNTTGGGGYQLRKRKFELEMKKKAQENVDCSIEFWMKWKKKADFFGKKLEMVLEN